MAKEKCINEFRERVKDEVLKDILPFWMSNTVDNKNGGFYGAITNDLNVIEDSQKALVICARILWTYSFAFGQYKNSEYLKMAERAYNYLIANFWDEHYSGAYWMLDCEGKPLDTKKQIYAEAFAIYGLSEYYMAFKSVPALEKAIELFELIERYGYDKQNKGYFEAYTREWTLMTDFRLLKDDLNEKKTMNTHLHILEAYTNLLRAWDNELLRSRLRELIEIMLEHIIDSNTYHFKLYFDEQWNSKSKRISFGHDIEGSWLLNEAAEMLGDKELIAKVKDVSVKMAQAVYDEGIKPDGGLIYEFESEKCIDSDRCWWVMAEAVVGFYNAYQISGEEHFFRASFDAWNFIETYIIDRKCGEWFRRVSEDLKPYQNMLKVDEWKCPYHNSRACFEIIKRLRLAEEIKK
jgi:mannobiose 2-epimerase